MGKIATEQDVHNIGKQGIPVQNKCCTKERVSELGCTLTKDRNNHQLVEKDTYTETTKIVEVRYKTFKQVQSDRKTIHWGFTASASEKPLTDLMITCTYEVFDSYHQSIEHGERYTHILANSLDTTETWYVSTVDQKKSVTFRNFRISPTNYKHQKYVLKYA